MDIIKLWKKEYGKIKEYGKWKEHGKKRNMVIKDLLNSNQAWRKDVLIYNITCIL